MSIIARLAILERIRWVEFHRSVMPVLSRILNHLLCGDMLASTRVPPDLTGLPLVFLIVTFNILD